MILLETDVTFVWLSWTLIIVFWVPVVVFFYLYILDWEKIKYYKSFLVFVQENPEVEFRDLMEMYSSTESRRDHISNTEILLMIGRSYFHRYKKINGKRHYIGFTQSHPELKNLKFNGEWKNSKTQQYSSI